MTFLLNVIEDPDSELLPTYRQSGSQEALGAISKKYYGFILGTCKRELRNVELAKDAAFRV